MKIPSLISLDSHFDLEKSVRIKIQSLLNLESKSILVIEDSDLREAVAWILATFYVPVVAAPIPPTLPEEARKKYLRQLPSDSLVYSKDLEAKAAESYPHSIQPKSTDRMWVIIFSSGSSGEPKGVALSGMALQKSAEAHFSHNGHLAWLLNLPIYHIGGFSIVSRAFFGGTPLGIETEKFSPMKVQAWLKAGVEGISMVPTQLYRVLLEPKFSPEQLKLALLGGASCAPDQLSAGMDIGLPLKRTYGLTEAASQVATEEENLGGLKLLPGFELRISADKEIQLKSPTLAMGYWQSGKLNPLPLEDGFFSTGDLGTFEFGVLKVEGRRSDVIHSGGSKIFPQPIEEAISFLPGIQDVIIFGVADPEWGELVCAAVVGGKSMGKINLISSLREKVSAKEIPKRWFEVEKLPRTSMGKLERARWREYFSHHKNQLKEL